MKNKKITSTFKRLVILIVLLLLVRTFAKQNRIFPLDLTFLGSTIGQLKDSIQEESPESLITGDLHEALLSNPLSAGDSIVGDALSIDYIQVQGIDLGCTEVVNPYARGDIPPDNSRGGDQAKIQALYQGNFAITLQQEDNQFFVVANNSKIVEVYCLRSVGSKKSAILLSQQDNLTYLVLEFNEAGQYTGKIDRANESK